MLHWFNLSHREFLAAIDGVNHEQWNWKPSADQWSVGEVAEHIVLSEASLFGAVRRAVASPRNPHWEANTKGKSEFIERIMAPRLGRAKAPESIIPRGGTTPDQIRERFQRQRIEIVKFSTETTIPLHEHTLEHPFAVFGTLSAYQWLLYIPLHTLRHHKQIAEVKATPGFPK